MSGVAGVCSGLVAVFHAQRVCPVENPFVWPRWVPPRRCACVYDAIFVGRSTNRINMLSSPCLCTANSGKTLALYGEAGPKRALCAGIGTKYQIISRTVGVDGPTASSARLGLSTTKTGAVHVRD